MQAAAARADRRSSDPIKTGKFKDSLSPFRDLSEDEREMWGAILEESHARFIDLIDETRENLDREQVAALATGQVFTASQALGNGLIDAIGFEGPINHEYEENPDNPLPDMKTGIANWRAAVAAL